MSRKFFSNDDIFISRLKMHPEIDFFIYNSEVFIGNKANIDGDYDDTYKNVPKGHVSLYELNINRDPSSPQNLAYPFLIRDGALYDLRGSLSSWNYSRKRGESNPGLFDIVTGSYPLSSSVFRELVHPAEYRDNGGNVITINNKAKTLYNIGKLKYSTRSKRFILSNEILTSSINIINVPSIFYGSSIKKGTITLKYHITGTLIASAVDDRQNGELIQNYGDNSGSVVGLVYYDEGIFMFPSSSVTGTNFTSSYFSSPALDDGNNTVYDGAINQSASWMNFGAGANDGITHSAHLVSASFSMNFLGTSYKNTMTLFCHAEKGEFNFSNNPTYLDRSDSSYAKFSASPYVYSEYDTKIKNIVSSSYIGHSASFKKTTYLSKVGIYDKNDNLIMIAEMARPYRKEEDNDLTFKLKYDLI